MNEYLNQSISFTDKNGNVVKKNNQEKIDSLDKDLSQILLNIESNQQKVLAAMIKECSNTCLLNFKVDKLTNSEMECIIPCQNKYFATVDIGVNIINEFLIKKYQV
jgi:hypothetical protein